VPDSRVGRRPHDIPSQVRRKNLQIVLGDIRELAVGQVIEQKENKPVTVKR